MDRRAVGNRIRAARRSKKLTQEQLAELVELSPSHVGVIERGVKSPNLDTFVAIVNALDVSADELLRDVVNTAPGGEVSQLSLLLDGQSPELKRAILRAIRAAIEK